MGVIRIDDQLQTKVEEWIKKNGNKYKHSSLASFANSAIYDKLKRLQNGEEA